MLSNWNKFPPEAFLGRNAQAPSSTNQPVVPSEQVDVRSHLISPVDSDITVVDFGSGPDISLTNLGFVNPLVKQSEQGDGRQDDPLSPFLLELQAITEAYLGGRDLYSNTPRSLSQPFYGWPHFPVDAMLNASHENTGTAAVYAEGKGLYEASASQSLTGFPFNHSAEGDFDAYYGSSDGEGLLYELVTGGVSIEPEEASDGGQALAGEVCGLEDEEADQTIPDPIMRGDRLYCPLPQCSHHDGLKTLATYRKHAENISIHTVHRCRCPEPGCSRSFTSEHILFNHLSKFHKSASLLDFSKGNVPVEILAQLNVPVDNPKLKISCPFLGCASRFARQPDVKRHFGTHHPESSYPYSYAVRESFSCWLQDCEAILPSREALELHIWEHEGRSGYSIRQATSCPEPGCTAAITTEANMKVHMRMHASRIRRRTLARSEQLATSPGARRGRPRDSAPIQPLLTSQQRHKCPITNCSHVFPSAEGLEEHILQHEGMAFGYPTSRRENKFRNAKPSQYRHLR